MDKNIKIISMIIGFIAIGGIFLFGSTFFQYINSSTEVDAKVEKLIEEVIATEDKPHTQKQVWTDQGIFIDKPDRLQAKYESAYFDRLLVGNTYHFVLSGKYIEGTGIYPNILKVEPLEGSSFKTTEENPQTEANDNSKKAEEFYNMGNILFKKQQYNEALENYKKAAELLPDNKIIQANIEKTEALLK
ncbi:MAG: tetratricopeptide repeat protein [Vampirovibrionia bacterium]